MDSAVKELQLDVEEMKAFLSSSKRERVKAVITKELHELEKQLLIVRVYVC